MSYEETQWTETAKARYREQVDAAIALLLRHSELVLARHGRESEIKSYFDSAQELQRAVKALNEAEFDWCGSFPLPLVQADDLDDEEHGDDTVASSASVLSVVGRWDFQITGPGDAISTGQDAYRVAWPDATEEDARVAVSDLQSAVAQIVHTGGLPALDDTAGISPTRSVLLVLAHDGAQSDFDDDPFGIVLHE